MEMIPGDAHTRMVEQIEADSVDQAWDKARARWYKSELEEQNRKTIIIPVAGVLEHRSVTPQIADIKEGEYVLPVEVPAPVDPVAEAIAQKAETEVELSTEAQSQVEEQPVTQQEHSVTQPTTGGS
jgi:hypothetical protein